MPPLGCHPQWQPHKGQPGPDQGIQFPRNPTCYAQGHRCSCLTHTGDTISCQLALCWWKAVAINSSSFFKTLFILRERECVCVLQGREKENPWGSNSLTVRSWPEPKSRVGHFTYEPPRCPNINSFYMMKWGSEPCVIYWESKLTFPWHLVGDRWSSDIILFHHPVSKVLCSIFQISKLKLSH